MMPEDMLCVTYIRGVRSNELREKLLEVAEPSLVRFDRIVDSFNQAKSQMAEIRKKPNQQKHQPHTNNRANGKGGQPCLHAGKSDSHQTTRMRQTVRNG